MARERYGNGYKGRGGTRRRMKARNEARLRGVGEDGRPCERAHGPRLDRRKGGNERESCRALHPPDLSGQKVEDEITEQRSIGVTAPVQSGVS